MCESAVYLVKGSKRALIMDEAARVLTSGSVVTCINAIGERTRVEDAEIAEADLMRHEIVLRMRQS